jgi:hypothetical protein
MLVEPSANMDQQQWRCPLCSAELSYDDLLPTMQAAPPLAIPVVTQLAESAISEMESSAPSDHDLSSIEPTAPDSMISNEQTEHSDIAEGSSAAPELAEEQEEQVAPAPPFVAHVTATFDSATLETSAPDAWASSLCTAEGASLLVGDFDDPETARPWHEDPAYNSHLAVITEPVPGETGHNAADVADEYEDDEYEADEEYQDADFDGTKPGDSYVDITEAPPVTASSSNIHDSPQVQATSFSDSELGAAHFAVSGGVEEETAFAPAGEWGDFGTGQMAGGSASATATVVDEYAIAAAPETIGEAAFTEAAPIQPPRRRKQKKGPGLLGALISIVGLGGSGVIGLAFGYIILLWIGGPQRDFLNIRHKLPGFLVPAEPTNSQPVESQPTEPQAPEESVEFRKFRGKPAK